MQLKHFAKPVVIEHRSAKHMNPLIPLFKFWLTHFILWMHTKCLCVTETHILIEMNLSGV